MTDPATSQRAQRRAWKTLAEHGGVLGRSDLRDRWNVTRARIGQLVNTPDFPEPIGHVNGEPVWLASDVDPWRASRPETGRPRKAKP